MTGLINWLKAKIYQEENLIDHDCSSRYDCAAQETLYGRLSVYRKILEILESPCDTCNGTGSDKLLDGSGYLCKKCNGIGYLIKEK